MKARIFSLVLVLMATISFAGCSPKREIAYEAPTPERYENPIEIEGQWGSSAATGADGQYGIGDPFVMRFNGKYYLYPSTSDPCSGIKVFESSDLIHWKDMGYAVPESDETSHGAYAPEVIYYDGYFYLCQSRAGQGHYIYRSESPTQGFTLISSSGRSPSDLDYGNIGRGIDGSFYVSDDGRLFLLHTVTPAGLQYTEITDVSDINPDTLGKDTQLGDANLNHWIEGPGIFRRGNYSYLTYAGNHVLSNGYRIAYSYAEDLDDLSSFVQPVDNVTIIDTDVAHRGLGHSSNVNGPDLDSVYTAYHSLVGRGPARRYNLDRYFACGSLLTANGVTHRSVAVPDAPDRGGYADLLQKEAGAYVFGETGDYFTAEYNFIPSARQEVFFGSASGKSYAVQYSGGTLRLLRREGKNENVIAEQNVSLTEGKLVTLRIENGDGVGYLYLNGMRVISYPAEACAGKTGYALSEGVGYTAYTDEVFGTSDFEALKNFPTRFPATGYLKGDMRGFSIRGARRVQGGVRVGEPESTVRIGDAYAVALERGDWVKYAVDIPEDGTYSLFAEVSAASRGAEICITIGENEVRASVPSAGEGYRCVRVPLGEIEAAGGVQTIRAEVVSGRAEITFFEAEVTETGAVSLTSYDTVNGAAQTAADGSVTVSGERGVIFWKNTGHTDFEAELTFSCELSVGTDLGFMIRSSDYSYHSAQPAESWRGYYLQLGTSIVTLNRYDYGDLGALGIMRTGDTDLGSGTHTLVIRAAGHAISVDIDGAVVFTARDEFAFLGGRLGVYVGSGSIILHSLKYQAK